MKRLIKKANQYDEMVELIDGLAEWCQWNLGALDVNKLIELNRDCLYTGKLYRGMGIQSYDFYDILTENNLTTPLTVGDLAELIKNECIYVDGANCSFSKDLLEVKTWNSDKDFYDDGCSYIVEMNGTGIDIEKVYNKWKDKINTKSMDVIKDCLYIKEVIAVLNQDFKVCAVQNETNFSRVLENEDELKNFLNI